MTRKLILILALFGHSALARPIERTLNQDERIPIPSLGISIRVPKNTQIIAPDQKEAVNYIFPWFITPLGEIELAKAAPQPKGSLKERIVSSTSQSETRGIHTRQIEAPIEIGGITFIPAKCEGTKGFKIKRYYFLTPNGELAYIHVVDSNDIESLESTIIKTIQKS